MKTVSSVVYVGGNLKHVCVFFRYLVYLTRAPRLLHIILPKLLRGQLTAILILS